MSPSYFAAQRSESGIAVDAVVIFAFRKKAPGYCSDIFETASGRLFTLIPCPNLKAGVCCNEQGGARVLRRIGPARLRGNPPKRKRHGNEMSRIAFLLNGDPVSLEIADPTLTLLDWLREQRGMTGTKEGCNEGDCGACSVMVGDEGGYRALNACILFMPQLQGKSVRTVEGLAQNGEMHPVQSAMIDLHGSQCGFCTPGFIMSMAAGHAQGRTDHSARLRRLKMRRFRNG
jgi:aerobic-type carbon monoxide dehydrogenase small subunit (CoxS/CutS family)